MVKLGMLPCDYFIEIRTVDTFQVMSGRNEIHVTLAKLIKG